MSSPRAVLLSGSLGLGHEMLVRSCTSTLEQSGWEVESLDCMQLLGRRSGAAGQRVFTRAVSAMPGLYDGLHFAHLRTGSSFARIIDRSACARLVPVLSDLFRSKRPELVLSVFATGASAAAKLRSRGDIDARTVVLCTDVTLHRLWVQEGTDLFLATSSAAAASVLRYLPRARVTVVPAPVRPSFYDAPTQERARAELGLPRDGACVLVIDSGWGFGPLEESVGALAREGVHVIAVAGRRRDVESGFRALAAKDDRVHAFGFVDDVPLLMAASDVVIALPGATTCSEARVVGRPLLLLDLMPGHGRENLLHELELGSARTCGLESGDIVEATLAMLDGARSATQRPVTRRWEPAFVSALESIGLDMGPGVHAGAAEGAPEPLRAAGSGAEQPLHLAPGHAIHRQMAALRRR